MEYYRSNIPGGVTSSNPTDIGNNLFNSASDSYASNYWNVPYSDGLSPMKQIEGKIFFGNKELKAFPTQRTENAKYVSRT